MENANTYISEDGFIRNKDISVVPIEENYCLLNKIINIDNQDVFFEANIYAGGNNINNIVASRQKFFSQSPELVNIGLPIVAKREWQQSLSQKENKVPVLYQHSLLGFSYYQGKHIFKAKKTIGGIESEYNGDFDISSKGTFEGWHEMISSIVMPTVELQLMVILGLAAVTIGFLDDLIDGSLLVHIYSDSSKGKTTGCALAISTAGNPFPTNSTRNLQIDYGDTENYRIATLAGNYGFPVVIDESSKINRKDISNFIYSCCNGKSKGRVASDGSLKDIQYWKTCCISNGEGSLLPYCNNNVGIRARLIEIQVSSITESAEQAEKLKAGLAENYGWANTIYAQYLLAHRKEVVDLFEQEAKTISATLTEIGLIAERLARKIAVITTTAELAGKCLNLSFQTEELKRLLTNSVIEQNKDEPVALAEKLMDIFMEDILAHKEGYGTIKPARYRDLEYRDEYFFPNNATGMLKLVSVKDGQIKYINGMKCSVKYLMEIEYYPHKFERLLERYGFTNKTICLNALEEEGYLLSDKDGHKRVKRTIGSFSQRVYVVRIPSNRFEKLTNHTLEELFKKMDIHFNDSEESTDLFYL